MPPMTFFDSLFRMQCARDRHNKAPLFRERVEFLTHLLALGRKEIKVRQNAAVLLQVNRTLGFSDGMRPVTVDELKNAGRQWAAYVGPLRQRAPAKFTYELYMQTARPWLRHHSCLVKPSKIRLSEERLIDFENRLRHEFGLASSTIESRSKHVSTFLAWLFERRVKLRDVTLAHLERYLDAKRASGWALATQMLAANALRIFFRHSEARGWVRPGLYEAIPTFLEPKHTFIRRGPSWQNIRRMIASLSRAKPIEIRIRAMVLLMATYGLRACEIRGLCIDDIDFENRILTVRRGKNRQAQRFPLSTEVAHGLRKYMSRARPISNCPFLFITSVTPHRPLAHGTVYMHIQWLFRRSSVESFNTGPHALRHACADRLIRRGASVPEIAAFLGHKRTRSAREYARHDLKDLRLVAEFSLKDLL
jgi:integrase/recombinase XerD